MYCFFINGYLFYTLVITSKLINQTQITISLLKLKTCGRYNKILKLITNLHLNFDIIKLWEWLNDGKKFLKTEVHSRLYPENLSLEQLEDQKIKQEIAEKGFYDVKNEISTYYLDILELFVEKGYVEKYNDTLYRIETFYEYYAYAPYLSPEGLMGIAGPRTINTNNLLIGSKQYSNFIKTAKELKNQIDLGYHRHIDHFDFSIHYSYDTVVYELKDKYFDIIALSYDPNTKLYEIILTEPIIEETKIGQVKRRKPIKNTRIDFMKGSSSIDPLIDKIDWKKEFQGYILHNKQAYKILNYENLESLNSIEFRHKDKHYLGKEIFDINNFFSRIFEDAVADKLRDEDYHHVIPRYLLEYFESDIDVYAEKGTRNTTRLYCECKFRVYDQELTETDIQPFIEKVKIIREKENKKGLSLKFWLVTNTEKISSEIKKLARDEKIDVVIGSINKNWRERSKWGVYSLQKVN